jgi:3-hydroxyacyl-[acyl-carrier-protein] dehydratase
MRFSLLDRIDELEPGVRISAVKTLSMAEEYLADHFPGFPVMPGVLMLEAMTQAGAWLIRASEDFVHSVVVLQEARNVKYGQFVEPGQTLQVTAEITNQTDRLTTLKARGTVDGRISVKAKLVIERYCLADVGIDRPDADEEIRRDMRALFALLWQPATELSET